MLFLQGIVSRVNIQNLRRTKDDILEEQIYTSGIYDSTNLLEVVFQLYTYTCTYTFCHEKLCPTQFQICGLPVVQF